MISIDPPAPARGDASGSPAPELRQPGSEMLGADTLRAIFDDAGVGIIVWDPAGRIRAVNGAFARMMGLSPSDFVGGALADHCADGDVCAAVAHHARMMERAAKGASEREPLELRLLHVDGRAVRILVTPSVVRGAGCVDLFATVEDVTAVRAREEALERSEARLRAIVDGAVEAIVTCDARGVIQSANPATERLFGYAADELIGANVAVLMPAEHSVRHDTYIANYLRTGEAKKVGIGRELPARRKDGETVPVWVSLSEIKLPGFHVFLAVMHDMSDAKEVETALRQARDAAMLADRAKTSFLSNISHELRTPLNGIIGFADVIQGQMLGELGNPAYLTYIGEIKRSGELLLANISDILEIATVEAGGGANLEETLVDFRDVAVTVIRLVSKRAQQARLTVEVDLRAELPPMRADPRALKQVLLNLMSNAIKFTEEGGVIGLSARLDDVGGLVVEVSDTGRGIPADRMEDIFRPFVQGNDSLTREHEGVGLGLSLARALVERHGGRVAIHSVEGEGTTVTLHLPKDRFIATR